MNGLTRIAIALGALGLTAAKGGDSDSFGRFPVNGPIAMAPFENLSGNRDAAGVLAWMLDGALREGGVRIAGELSPGLFSGRLATPLELQQAAAGLGAEWTLSGTIQEYGYREAAIHGDPKEPIVSLDLRLVSVTSGEIAWQRTFSASSHGASRRRSLAAVSRAIAAEVAAALAREGSPPGETVTRQAPTAGSAVPGISPPESDQPRPAATADDGKTTK